MKGLVKEYIGIGHGNTQSVMMARGKQGKGWVEVGEKVEGMRDICNTVNNKI